jgi:hypothetical protein
MIKSLRKGRANVYLQHQHTGNTVSAEHFQAEVRNKVAVVSLSLRPSGSDQTDDEEYFRTNELLSLAIDDELVIKSLKSFLGARRHEFTSWRLEVFSRKQRFSFVVTPIANAPGSL